MITVASEVKQESPPGQMFPEAGLQPSTSQESVAFAYLLLNSTLAASALNKV